MWSPGLISDRSTPSSTAGDAGSPRGAASSGGNGAPRQSSLATDPRGRGELGGAGRGEQDDGGRRQRGAALGRGTAAAAQLGGRDWDLGRAGALACPDLADWDLGFLLGRLGRLFFSQIYVIGPAFAMYKKKSRPDPPADQTLPSAPGCAHGISNFAECPTKTLGKVFLFFCYF